SAHLRGRVPASDPSFDIDENGAAISSATGERVAQTLRVRAYPGIDGSASVEVPVAGPPQSIAAPAGGSPAAITSIPQVGSLLASAASLGLAEAGALSTIPGQSAVFTSARLPHSV